MVHWCERIEILILGEGLKSGKKDYISYVC